MSISKLQFIVNDLHSQIESKLITFFRRFFFHFFVLFAVFLDYPLSPGLCDKLIGSSKVAGFVSQISFITIGIVH